MPTIRLILGAAIFCAGSQSLFAQLELPSRLPTPAPQLLAQVGSAELADDFDPFDFDAIIDSQPVPPAPEESAETRADAGIVTAAPADPASLPEGHQAGIVDTIHDFSVLADVPNAAIMPVDWQQGVSTPNPVGDYLLRQHCVDGLWDGYAAQRAAECAAMWARLNGHGCHRSTVCGPCTVCAGPQTGIVRNRYRTQATTPVCDGGAACDAPCSADLADSPPAPVAAEQVPSTETRDQVAQLPEVLMR